MSGVSIGNGVDLGNLVTSQIDSSTGGIKLSSGIGKLKPQSPWLVKPSVLQMDYTDPSITWGYSSATSALDKTYQRFSNYTLRIDITANSAQVLKGTRSITADSTDQMLSIHIYIPFMPQSGGSGQSINVLLTNANGYNANNHVFGFDSGYLRQGWNELRMWAGDTNGASGTGTLAFGATKTQNGTGCDFTSNIGYVEITFQNMNGKSVYLDSVRRSSKVRPCLVMGFDATGLDVSDNVFVTKVAPLFQSYGYQGYFTVTWIYDMLYSGGADDLRKRTLYATYGWDSLVHTWNHGATTPGTSFIVTGTAASDVVTLTKTTHGYPVGSKFYANISGVTSPTQANGVFEMTVATANTITYTASGAGTATLTGTISLSTYLFDVVNTTGTLQTQIIQHELADTATLMRANGFNRGSGIGGWPNNSCPELVTTKAVCDAAGIKLFRGIKGGTVKFSEFGIDNPLHFGSVEMGSGGTATTLQNLKDKLTGAIGRGEHMWTYGHYIQDDTDPTQSAYFPVDNGYPPGSNGNPNPRNGVGQGGWWYYSTLKRFFDEAVQPAVSANILDVKRPSDWAASIGISV